MLNVKEESYTKEIYDNNAYYTIRWSKYQVCNKFEVTKKAPNRAGIFVLFYLNKAHKLQPFYLGYAWTSSIKFDIKFYIVEDANRHADIAKIIDDKKCYYKFVIVEKYNDLVDMYDLLKALYSQKEVKYIKEIDEKTSGLYNEVFVTDYAELIKQR
jgi:hypothetical protein